MLMLVQIEAKRTAPGLLSRMNHKTPLLIHPDESEATHPASTCSQHVGGRGADQRQHTSADLDGASGALGRIGIGGGRGAAEGTRTGGEGSVGRVGEAARGMRGTAVGGDSLGVRGTTAGRSAAGAGHGVGGARVGVGGGGGIGVGAGVRARAGVTRAHGGSRDEGDNDGEELHLECEVKRVCVLKCISCIIFSVCAKQ
ncbi:hypothetical protein GGR56DRAFT_653517 [Xylariaceae sp. FL0804]|nr:hypothetical protein GGR56DRAFT_653517 [Xylariaceae sp. FL0804]